MLQRTCGSSFVPWSNSSFRRARRRPSAPAEASRDAWRPRERQKLRRRRLLPRPRACRSAAKIVCGREHQQRSGSARKALLESRIEHYGLRDQFSITETSIIVRSNGSEFAFIGLAKNIDNVRSMHDVNLWWLEESQRLSHKVLRHVAADDARRGLSGDLDLQSHPSRRSDR